MRTIILNDAELRTLNAIKRIYIKHCIIPNARELSAELGEEQRTVSANILHLNVLGVLKPNRCRRWRFSRTPYRIEVV